MKDIFKASQESAHDIPYYAARIEILQGKILPPDVSIGRELAAGAMVLTLMYQEHGDKSKPTYKPYHDDEHPLDVLGRDWKILTILQSMLPERFDNSIYGRSMLPALGHDIFNDPEASPGENERRSAEFVRHLMLLVGYSSSDAECGYEMVEGTAVRRDDNGTIIQNNIRQGSKDPLKWALANADINGMPMEGIPTMVSNAFDLYLEFTKTPIKELMHHPAGAAKFFQTQAKFLHDRLAIIDEDMSYYFTEEEKRLLQRAFEKEFTGTTRDAISATKMLLRFPEMPELIVNSAISKADVAVSAGAEQLDRIKHHVVELLHRTQREES